MKKDIHPDQIDAVFTCSCGASLKTKSVLGNTEFGICSQCHPFYTGKQLQAGAEGRAEMFKRKYNKKRSEIASASTTTASPAAQ